MCVCVCVCACARMCEHVHTGITDTVSCLCPVTNVDISLNSNLMSVSIHKRHLENYIHTDQVQKFRSSGLLRLQIAVKGSLLWTL